jgi:hypothetical protein
MKLRIAPAGAALAVAVALTGPGTASGAIATATNTSATTSTGAHAAAERAAMLTVQVTVTESGITRSRTGFRPGNTLFQLTAEDARAAVQLLRLRKGYTLSEFRSDFADDENLAAIRRIDRKVVFYGGMPAGPRRHSQFGMWLDAGRYHLVDLDRPTVAVGLRVQGPPQRRALPRATGAVDMVLKGDDHPRFRTPARLPRSGWLRQTNRTDEPHFMDLAQVRESTTRKQVRRALSGNGQEEPPWLIKFNPGTFVVSPGRTVVWKYDFPRGKYLELCFWPDDETGMPHALMGMFNFTHLR